MGWAENRIEEYHHGQLATWRERRVLEHANPLNSSLHLAGFIGLFYGLWEHSWPWIIGSIFLSFLGHLYCWTRPARHASAGSAIAGHRL